MNMTRSDNNVIFKTLRLVSVDVIVISVWMRLILFMTQQFVEELCHTTSRAFSPMILEETR